jgi:hypothetical protein
MEKTNIENIEQCAQTYKHKKTRKQLKILFLHKQNFHTNLKNYELKYKFQYTENMNKEKHS